MLKTTQTGGTAFDPAIFDASQLIGHFAVGRNLPVLPDGWRRESQNGWTLVCEPRLRAVEVTDAEGARIGWLLGDPLDLAAQSPASSARLPVSVASTGFVQALEKWLYAYAGRFAVVLPPPVARVYVDAFASLPVVYRPERETVASSPFLIAAGNELRLTALASALGTDRTRLWSMFGATPYVGIDRLVPNHALDLRTWTQHRHWWPDPVELDAAVPQLIEQIERALVSTIAALAVDAKPNISLTAGRDSRLLLAASRALLDRVRFFTATLPDDLARIDLRTAPSLARRFGVEYRALPWVSSSRDDIDLYRYRTGDLVGEQFTRPAPRTYAQLGKTEPYVAGVGGELLDLKPGALDLPPGTPQSALTGAEVLRRYAYHPSHPELVRAADLWLRDLPDDLDPFNRFQLFHQEMLYGSWGGALTTGYPDGCSSMVFPYGQRAVLEAAFRLPFAYRGAGAARRELINALWPELLDVGYNIPPLGIAVRYGVRRRIDGSRAFIGRTLRKISRERS